MADVSTEGLPHAAGFLISEANGALSREAVTVHKESAIVKAGTVMAVGEDGQYRPLDLASSEGNTTSDGILLEDVDSTGAAAAGVIIARLAEVRDDDLIWPTGISAGNKATEVARLLTLNIAVRAVATTVSTQTT